MSVLKRVKDTVRDFGARELLVFLDRRYPLTADRFVARLNEDIHLSIDELEAVRHHLQRWEGDKHHTDAEESMRSRLLNSLRCYGYRASAETDVAGSADLVVTSDVVQVTWIGECKVHRSYDNLVEGMLQLHTRYTSGRHPDSGFIVFCFNPVAKAVLDMWRKVVEDRKLCGLIEVTPDDPAHALCFGSRHKHVGAGLEVLTRHVVAALWHKPGDKSGRASRSMSG